MTRRNAVRRLALMTFGMTLGQLNVVKAQGGELRVPLDQWHVVIFERKGKRVEISVDEIFAAVKGGA